MRLNSRLNIAVFVPWITTGRGGTEHVGSLLANRMAEFGHNVSVHTFDDKKADPLWPLRKDVNLHHHPEMATSSSEEKTAEVLASFNIDVLVGLHITREFSRYISYAKLLDIPVILSEHSDPSIPRMLGLNTQKERLETFSAADTIHLINRDFRKTLPRKLARKTVVIPNTVNRPEPKKEKGDRSENTRTILTVARLTKIKNTVNLVRSFAKVHHRHPEWELKIAGYGPELEELQQEVSNLGISGKVSFLGKVNETDQLFANADIYALPSLKEGFPLSSLEAMAHGLPVIGYRRCPGLNQQIENGVNGFLCWGGRFLGTMPRQLSKLMASNELRQQMGQASVEIFERDYAPEKIADQWEKMIANTHRRFHENDRSAGQ